MSFTSAFFYSILLGILTSVSPCPLATNIVALSWISKRIAHPYLVFLYGIFYSLGRMFLYVILSVIILIGLTDLPLLSNALQTYLPKIIGPILIIAGIFILELITINLPSISPNKKLFSYPEKYGLAGSFILGFLLALSFCPNSAALFFGGLIPLATSKNSSIVLPAIYGISTGLPVLFFAILISTGTTKVATAYNIITPVETWVRKITGAIFIIIGIYFSLKFIFKIPLPI